MDEQVCGVACVRLLGGFELTSDRERVALPLGTQRLLAILAMEENGLHREAASELLWPDQPVRRASANLRSALWGCKRFAGQPLLDAGPRLRLSEYVRVDLRDVLIQAKLIAEAPNQPVGADHPAVVKSLGKELLPNWSDDWILFEREGWDQVRLHTLEFLATQLRTDRQYLAALQTALKAVSIEPLREAAHRIVIEVHLAEGNFSSAVSYYQRYRRVLQRELGVAPSPSMSQLVRGLQPT
jgi:DNA-binding SARP family transcriptional activator